MKTQDEQPAPSKNDKRATANRQADKFRQAAREVQTDDREEAFDAALKKIAKSPPVDKRGEKVQK